MSAGRGRTKQAEERIVEAIQHSEERIVAAIDGLGESLGGKIDANGAILERIARSLEGRRRDEGDVLDFEPGKQA